MVNAFPASFKLNLLCFDLHASVPDISLLILGRSAGQELLTAPLGSIIPWLLYTSRRFPETGSCTEQEEFSLLSYLPTNSFPKGVLSK